MQLVGLIPKAEDLEALEPEELALLMVKHMNTLVDDKKEKNLFHYTNYCNSESNAYVASGQKKVNRELMAAWNSLVASGLLAQDPTQASGWYFLTKRARLLHLESDYKSFRNASQFKKGMFHPRIEAECYGDFLRGEYDTAVFKAFKLIEVAVRTAANLPQSMLGTALMREAFNPTAGRLTDLSEEQSERESLAHLFAGAIGRFKNPSSHRVVSYDETAAVVEVLGFASLLLRVVEVRNTTKGSE